MQTVKINSKIQKKQGSIWKKILTRKFQIHSYRQRKKKRISRRVCAFRNPSGSRNRSKGSWEAEDAVLEQMIEEQRVIDGLNSDINENLDRTRESRKFNQEFQEKINTQIYEMNGITEDKLKGMRGIQNAYYQGCAFSLFLLSVVMIGICGVLHGFESQICLFMIACTGVEGHCLHRTNGEINWWIYYVNYFI